MRIDISGKKALVTGSSRGIGRSIAIELAKHGADIVVNFRKREEEAKRTAHEIEKIGKNALVIGADVSKKEDVERMFKVIESEYGGIDILVNNAGWGLASPFMSVDEKLWDRTINVNLKSVYLCTTEALKLMKTDSYGRIINITSIAGIIGLPFLAPYSAAKAGIIGLTKALATELSETKVTVNAIAAGIVKTKMGESLFQVMKVDEKTWAEKNTLTGSVIDPREVAGLAVFLTSEEAKNVTGQVFVIDSGLSLAISKRMFD